MEIKCGKSGDSRVLVCGTGRAFGWGTDMIMKRPGKPHFRKSWGTWTICYDYSCGPHAVEMAHKWFREVLCKPLDLRYNERRHG